jgi:hypothetical protein
MRWVEISLDCFVAVGGLGLLSYGSWLAWRPAGFIVPGALLVAFFIGAAYLRARQTVGERR